MAQTATARPYVVLMDIRMPVMDGLEATRRIASDPQLTAVHVLILTTFETDDYAFNALRAGASGFVVKDILPAELLTAVRVDDLLPNLRRAYRGRRVAHQRASWNRSPIEKSPYSSWSQPA